MAWHGMALHGAFFGLKGDDPFRWGGLEEVDRRYWPEGPCDGCQLVKDRTPTAVQNLLGKTPSLPFSITLQNAPPKNPDA